ncbi:hypothetical protein BDU57DRAFT_528707 [Ampelomyces quisqualis]|uniref:Uncharacterized protein n=1 Tax=Ampelomyces quisqualis TaxID=50730 RepID=A0A6A5QU01_AMPQU|nr:hypothetical protein BDU57DRAFT_528707 [Ampelomyces quisqualis]
MSSKNDRTHVLSFCITHVLPRHPLTLLGEETTRKSFICLIYVSLRHKLEMSVPERELNGEPDPNATTNNTNGHSNTNGSSNEQSSTNGSSNEQSSTNGSSNEQSSTNGSSNGHSNGHSNTNETSSNNESSSTSASDGPIRTTTAHPPTIAGIETLQAQFVRRHADILAAEILSLVASALYPRNSVGNAVNGGNINGSTENGDDSGSGTNGTTTNGNDGN